MFLNFTLQYGLQIFLWIIFVLAIFFYAKQRQGTGERLAKCIQLLVFAVFGGRVLDAAIKTVGQYYLWSKSGHLTQTLISAGLDNNLPSVFNKIFIFQGSGGYFLFYSMTRFWFNVFASVSIALIFGIMLFALEKRAGRFFEYGETRLGILAAILIGWPNFLIFLPIFFGSTLLISAIRLLFFKIKYTTLGFPFVLACGITFGLSGVIGPLINLNVLNI